MNERIKALYEKSLDRGNRTDHNGNPVLAIHQNPTKFAELIVKETMQVVANNLPQNTYLDVADAVIEHFKE